MKPNYNNRKTDSPGHNQEFNSLHVFFSMTRENTAHPINQSHPGFPGRGFMEVQIIHTCFSPVSLHPEDFGAIWESTSEQSPGCDANSTEDCGWQIPLARKQKSLSFLYQQPCYCLSQKESVAQMKIDSCVTDALLRRSLKKMKFHCMHNWHPKEKYLSSIFSGV